MNFFNAILDFFSNIYLFLSNMISSLLNATMLIQYIPTFLVSLLGFVPSVIGASISAVLAIGVVKLILGWGNAQ